MSPPVKKRPEKPAKDVEPKAKAARVDPNDKAQECQDRAHITDSGELQVSTGADPMGSHEPAAKLPAPAAPTLPGDNESALPFLKKMLPWLSSRLLEWIPSHMPELLDGPNLTSLAQLQPLKIGNQKGFKELYDMGNMAVALQAMSLYEAGFTLWMADLRPVEDEDDELWSVYNEFIDKARSVVKKCESVELTSEIVPGLPQHSRCHLVPNDCGGVRRHRASQEALQHAHHIGAQSGPRFGLCTDTVADDQQRQPDERSVEMQPLGHHAHAHGTVHRGEDSLTSNVLRV